MAKIGFVGLGHMGLPMAINLLKAGHTVTGYDLKNQLVNNLQNAGGIKANSLKELSQNQDFIITMLQTGEQVLNACNSKDGLFANAKPNAIFIDCSTIDVESARKFHNLAKEYNFMSVEAPVSGGVSGAKNANLTFMVGGTQDAFTTTHSILSAMGAKIIYTGDAGSGQAAKICNNMLLGISMIASAEAFILAKSLGLSEKKLHEVVTSSSGKCWVMEKYVPVANVLENVPANNRYQAGFTTAMMLKDLNLSQQTARTAGVSTKLGELAQQIYQTATDNNYGELDFSAIILEKEI